MIETLYIFPELVPIVIRDNFTLLRCNASHNISEVEMWDMTYSWWGAIALVTLPLFFITIGSSGTEFRRSSLA